MNGTPVEYVSNVGLGTPVSLSLESRRGRVTEIIIVREPAPIERNEAQKVGTVTLVPDDFDDDLANATWEDAEWR